MPWLVWLGVAVKHLRLSARLTPIVAEVRCVSIRSAQRPNAPRLRHAQVGKFASPADVRLVQTTPLVEPTRSAKTVCVRPNNVRMINLVQEANCAKRTDAPLVLRTALVVQTRSAWTEGAAKVVVTTAGALEETFARGKLAFHPFALILGRALGVLCANKVDVKPVQPTLTAPKVTSVRMGLAPKGVAMTTVVMLALDVIPKH